MRQADISPRSRICADVIACAVAPAGGAGYPLSAQPVGGRAACLQSWLPDRCEVKHELREDRVAGELRRVLHDFHWSARSIDVHTSLARIDQPPSCVPLARYSVIFSCVIGSESEGDNSSTTKSGHKGRNSHARIVPWPLPSTKG